MTNSERDHYQVLGVDTEADRAAIRSAYRRRARESHPDHGGDAEEFHQVQEAWDILGDERRRGDYDRRRAASGRTGPENRRAGDRAARKDESGAGFTYGPGAGAQRTRTRGPRDEGRRRSPAADRPPLYEPDLSVPDPLSLPLTSQRIHGGIGSSGGLFGGGRGRRRRQLTLDLLERHVLPEVPAARLFNDVHITPAAPDRRGRMRTPRNGERAEHVLLCGDTLLLVASLQVPGDAAHWDGRTLRTGGRALPLPDLSGQSRRLRETLQDRVREEHGRESFLRVAHQVVLHAPDGSLMSPVVETSGSGAQNDPLAPGRAMRRITDQLVSSDRANVVDRCLMAALRGQLGSPEEP